MIVLTASHVRALIGMADAMDAVARGCVEYTAGRSNVPLRTELRDANAAGETLVMPGSVPAAGALGCKLISEFPGNASRGLPAVTAVLVLLEGTSGVPSGVMDGLYLTNLRTAALTGIAAQRLAPTGARVAAVLGTGGLAPCQVWALAETLGSLEEVRVWGRRPENARELADRVVRDGLARAARVQAVHDVQAAVDRADVIVTVTASHGPLVRDEWIRPDALVCAMGSHTPDAQELPTSLVARANKVYADSRAGVLGRAGDVIVPIRAGALTEDRVWELGDLIGGTRPGRERDELIVFKSCGFAALDLVLGADVQRRAVERGLGLRVDLLG